MRPQPCRCRAVAAAVIWRLESDAAICLAPWFCGAHWGLAAPLPHLPSLLHSKPWCALATADARVYLSGLQDGVCVWCSSTSSTGAASPLWELPRPVRELAGVELSGTVRSRACVCGASKACRAGAPGASQACLVAVVMCCCRGRQLACGVCDLAVR